MERRMPVAAGSFYDASPRAGREHVQRCVGDYQPPDDLGEVVGGVVPHAGWSCSGPTAAKVFLALRPAAPETFVLFGAAHRPCSRQAQAHPAAAWATPLGDVQVDVELLEAVSDAGIQVSPDNHEGEHSIEVQLPFIQVLFPDARILPISAPHDTGAAEAGQRTGAALKSVSRRVAVLASCDLTHYGMGYAGPTHGPLPQAMQWMRQNDERFIRLVERLDADAVVPEAAEHANACGAGAVAAAMAAARELGATRGIAIEYTTSAEVLGEIHADRAVGYLAAVFVK